MNDNQMLRKIVEWLDKQVSNGYAGGWEPKHTEKLKQKADEIKVHLYEMSSEA